MSQHADVGEPTTLEFRFAKDGALADPTSVSVVITSPAGVVTTITSPDPELLNPEVGVWTYDLTPDAAGAWAYRGEGDGAVKVTEPDRYLLVGDIAPRRGVCEDWSTPTAVLGCRDDLAGKVNEGQLTDAVCQASDLLYQLSDRAYPGVCRSTRSVCAPCVVCARSSCCCDRGSVSVPLPGQYPVLAVLEVVLDGETLPRADYRVDDWHWLTRTDEQAWPRCTDLTDRDSFRVTYLHGRVPPPAGARAAAIFAGEIAAACVEGMECAIPERVNRIEREGVTFAVIDAQHFLDEGRTGITLVDTWLVADKRGRRAPAGGFDPATRPLGHALGTDTGGAG